jgi:hypothetical protein
MVQGLHQQGLRVVMDVVYNHTSASQQGALSVLDKIVPTYYYRLNAGGGITNDSCCADTASENAMMAKLMIDSTSTWARDYKIDGFRFDIMGFTPLAVMKQLQAAVNQAAGRDIYLYGEAWNFGTVANDSRFVQARQANMYGSGIGSFNDRIRDTVRGGGCCDGGEALLSQQGLINGVWYDNNGHSSQTKDDLLRWATWPRWRCPAPCATTASPTASARCVKFGDRLLRPAGRLRGAAVGDHQLRRSARQPDPVRPQRLQAAAEHAAGRARAGAEPGRGLHRAVAGRALPARGPEILRSKSMDRDSYDAGDWFNKLDYSYQSNNFGVGLPLAAVNSGNWSLMSPILANPLIKPDTAAIVSAAQRDERLPGDPRRHQPVPPAHGRRRGIAPALPQHRPVASGRRDRDEHRWPAL